MLLLPLGEQSNFSRSRAAERFRPALSSFSAVHRSAAIPQPESLRSRRRQRRSMDAGARGAAIASRTGCVRWGLAAAEPLLRLAVPARSPGGSGRSRGSRSKAERRARSRSSCLSASGRSKLISRARTASSACARNWIWSGAPPNSLSIDSQSFSTCTDVRPRGGPYGRSGFETLSDESGEG